MKIIRLILPVIMCYTISGQPASPADSTRDTTLVDSIIIFPEIPEPLLADSSIQFQILEDDSINISLSNLLTDTTAMPAIEIFTPPSSGTVNISGNYLKYRPVSNYSGSDSLIFTCTDTARTDTGRIIFSILAVNDPPVFTIPRMDTTLIEDQSLLLYTAQLTSAVRDEDGDSIKIEILKSEYLHVNQLPDSWEIAPASNWNGNDTLLITARDRSSADTALLTITVLPVNDPPAFEISKLDTTFKEDTSIGISQDYLFGLITDIDNKIPELSLTLETRINCTTVLQDDIFRITPVTNWYGQDSMNLIVSDHEFSDSIRIFINVTPVNDPPRFTAPLPDIKTYEDVAITLDHRSFHSTISDPDDRPENITWKISGGNNILIRPKEQSSGLINRENWFGPDTLIVIACDQQFCDSTYLPVLIRPINDPPVILPLPPMVCREDSSISFVLDDYVYDIDDQKSDIIWTGKLISLSPDDLHLGFWENLITTDIFIKSKPHFQDNPIAAIPKQSAWINIDQNKRIATINSVPNFNSKNTSFILEAIDPGGRKSWAVLRVSFIPVNDPPEFIESKTLKIDEDQPLLIPMSDWYSKVIDIDNHGSELIWTFNKGHHINIDAYPDYTIITPDENWSGTDTVEVIVNDNQFERRDSLVVIVAATNDPPAKFNLIGHDSRDSVLTLSWYPSYDIDSDHLEYFTVIESAGWDTTIISRSNTIQLNQRVLQRNSDETVYNWYVLACDSLDTTRSVETMKLTSLRKYSRHRILANYPNPFNNQTTIPFELAYATPVTITVYDIYGRKVSILVNEFLGPGRHTVTWDGSDNYKQAASGIYVVELRIDKFRDIRKIMLIK